MKGKITNLHHTEFSISRKFEISRCTNYILCIWYVVTCFKKLQVITLYWAYCIQKTELLFPASMLVVQNDYTLLCTCLDWLLLECVRNNNIKWQI